MNTPIEIASPPTSELNGPNGENILIKETAMQRWRWRFACTAIAAAAGLNIVAWVGAVLMSFGWFVVGTVSLILTLIVWWGLNRFRVLESALVWVGLPSCIFLFAADANVMIMALPFVLLALGAIVGWTLPAVDRAQITLQTAVARMVAKYDDGRVIPYTGPSSLEKQMEESCQRMRDMSNGHAGIGPYFYFKREDEDRFKDK